MENGSFNMNIIKTLEFNFTPEEEKALEIVYNIFDEACDIREDEKGCRNCPLEKNCPLSNGNRVEAIENFIRKIAD